jgi:uncharacterized protein with von Willebrand factor type A (vWA) domain
MPTVDELLASLLDEGADDLKVDIGAGVQVKKAKPKSKNAMIVDNWTKDASKDLANGEWNLRSDGFTHLNTDAEVADAFAASFDWVPMTDPNAEDMLRKRWYDSLIESPEFKEMHISTQGNPFLSNLATTQFASDYYVYAATLTEEEKKDAESEKPSLDSEMKKHQSTKKAAEAGGNEVQDASDLADAFGLEDGADGATENAALAELFQRAKKDHRLRRIAELAGRYRRLAQSLQQSKPVHGMDDLIGVELGSDISRLTVGELGNMMTEELEIDTLRRIVDGEAHCREYQSLAQENRGPIMVLVDESGSMSGDPIAEAKALALALTWLARHQNRWMCLVGWSSARQVRTLALPPNHDKQSEIISWCQQMYGGGTHPPVRQIPQLFEETGAPVGKTDVIWITDGSCHIDESAVAELNAFRETNNVRSFVLGIGGHPHGFEPIADEIQTVESLNVEAGVVEDILSI